MKTFEISGVELIKQRVKYFKTENFPCLFAANKVASVQSSLSTKWPV